MKALLLSAGLGTRLRPLTEKIPKVMVPINGKSCLEYHIENLRNYGVKEFAINLHHFSKKITDYFEDGVNFGIKINYSHESNLLGTSGSLNNFKNFFQDTFVVVYGDTLANFDLEKLLSIHKRSKAEATIYVDNREDKRGKGLVLTEGNRITDFLEKPKIKIEGSLVNSGFYILEPQIFNRIPEGFSDFAINIFPEIVKEKQLYFGKHNGFIFDIGDSKTLKKAEQYLKYDKRYGF